MFSTDKNIETIAELIEAVSNYIGLQTKFVKLDVIEKIVRLLTALTMVAVLLLLLFIGLIYLSFAAAYALAPLMDCTAARAEIEYRRVELGRRLKGNVINGGRQRHQVGQQCTFL